MLLALLALLPQPWHQFFIARGDRFIDLDVYRQAGVSLLHHRPVYGYLTAPPQNLPFTYPPTSALLSLPLALLPHAFVDMLWLLGCYVLVLGLTAVAFRDLLIRKGPYFTAFALPALFVAMAYLFPVRSVVHYGQVGLVLMALCVADCLTPDTRLRWPRGVLIGLAAAMKLTPAVFIPYLWLSGRRRAAYVAAGSFLGFVAVTWAIIPGTSTKYWTDALFNSDRLGDNSNTSNQALRGGILRLAASDSTKNVLWLTLVLIVAVAGFRRARRASLAGNELAGVAIVGLLAVLLSPVAWIHHLVWLVLVVGVLLGTGATKRQWITAAVVCLFFSLTTPWIAHHKIYDHVPQSELSMRLPGAQGWIDFTSAPPGKPPKGTSFRRSLAAGGYSAEPSSLRTYVGPCLGRAQDSCLVVQHEEGAMWWARLGESSFLIGSVVLVAVLPIGARRREDQSPPHG